ncbi:hypothetical protein [Gimesia maris]|uniref:Uncharacterized protein n=1 Tax=Gimesia maris TaxID=122 RepID=A0ABX5YIS6_9PLAN|nr:hypothetical protein [Gimesia maris]QEG15529.1 hypothetical protein GmarT_13700 [Gimesia maris]QGQ31173.1 hypothetical protein F1729_22445 [Gimesia maris]
MAAEESETTRNIRLFWQQETEKRKAEEVELAKQKIREEGIVFNVDQVYEQRERDRKYKLKLQTLKEKGKLRFQDLIRFR